MKCGKSIQSQTEGGRKSVSAVVAPPADPRAVATSSTRVDLSAADLPKGGVWRICYCANYDAGDGVASACSRAAAE